MTSANPLANRQRVLTPFRISVGIIIALATVLGGAASVYTDWLWFDQLGYSSVLMTQVGSQIALFVVGFAIMAAVIGASLWTAYRSRPIYAQLPDQTGVFAQYRELLTALRRLIMIGVPLLLGVFAGAYAVSQWQIVITWLNRSYTGEVDPQFGLDISFYLFDLPFFAAAAGFLSAVLLLAVVLSALVNLVFGGIRFNGREARISRAARIQIAVTAALYFLVQAGSIWLDQYATMTSSSGLYTGATFADVNATIPGLQIMALISVLVAALFLVAAVIGRWRLPVMATALMIISSLVLGGLYPWIVQTLQVVPNERVLEAEYINRNIDATRKAYGLDGVEQVEYAATTDATAGALRADAATTANIRILDPSLVSSSFRQLEQYKQYYGFENHLDVDRYEIDGKVQDTVLAVRELNQTGLGASRSWYNDTIVYTHGYGVVAAYGNQNSSEGQPVFLQKGIPSTGALGDYEPRIYFGEQSPAYSIVGAKKGSEDRELDYPAGDSEANQTYTTFAGDGGPKLNNIFARIAYALKFQSEQILLSDAISDESQVLYKRDPRERVAAVAPYLTLDSDAYPAVVDGRVLWIIDGYTTSNNYPYSRSENFSRSITDTSTTDPTNRVAINYIRNSVKATVEAYDGSVTLYAWDTEDPILKTWSKVFPTTLEPISKMSSELLSHVRYPADLFKMQRAIYGSYHVSDAGSFYSEEDAWMTPNDPVDAAVDATGTVQPPFYLTMKLPGAKESSYSLYSTYIPRSTGAQTRNVLRGYLVANSNAGNQAGKVASGYGKLTLLALPNTAVIPGPGQVQNTFTSDSEVSRLLNILRQGSTKVLNGNLLTLPVGGGLLYVQPVYIQSTGETSYPLLKKVLVAFGDKIAFEDTLSGALDALFGGGSGVITPTDPNNGETPTTVSDQIKAQLAIAQQALADKAAALAAGDWTAYGKADDRLNAAVSQLLKLVK